MKKILLLLFCFLGSILNAQNYQNICTPGITFYKNSSGNIKAYRQDSVYLPGNNDTIFISYRTIRPFFINGCYDTPAERHLQCRSEHSRICNSAIET